ncbi:MULTISPECIES: glycosyltransferase family 2 protein [unclassified Microbacterium]|uniref:glycosyltransferase family 2 protein n=1 Tax=unclassified Microbacterium TaxID=2609290 RepID=UPI003C2DAFEB
MTGPSGESADAAVDISFVIPVFNSAPWIEACIESALRQSGVRAEVICVDDGSTDASNEIISSMAARDTRVILLEQVNSGQSVARNKGVDAARGRYVAFLDSDDLWHMDAAASLIDIADRDELDVLLFDGHAFLEGGVESATWERYKGYYQRDAGDYPDCVTGITLMARMRRRGHYRPHVGLYLARRAFVHASGVGFIPHIVHQDNAYTFALMLRAERASHVATDVYARRLRPHSTITSLDAYRSVLGYVTAYVDMRHQLRRASAPLRYRAPLRDIVRYALRGAARRYGELTPASVDALRKELAGTEAREVLDALQRHLSRRALGFRRR